MIFLLKYWQPMAGALFAFVISYLLHSVDVSFIEGRHDMEVRSLTIKLEKECEDEKKITSEVSHDYQTKIASLNARIASLKRLREGTCVEPASSAATGRDGPSPAGEPARAHGIAPSALYDLAGEGEQYRLQLISCQDFINRVWGVTK